MPARRPETADKGEGCAGGCRGALGPGGGATLGNSPGEDAGYPLALRQVHHPEGGSAAVTDAPRRPVQVVDGRGLDRVDDDELRSLRSGDLHDPADLGLDHDADRLARGPVEEAEPGGPQPDLSRLFLPCRVENGGMTRTDD